MTKKICIIHVAPADVEAEIAAPYMRLYNQTLNRIKGPDVKIIHKVCKPGTWKASQTVVDYFAHGLMMAPMCKAAMEAEKEGADAITVACADDPGIRIMRTLVDIPVIGEFESTIHLAAQLGHKFGVLVWPTRPYMARNENLIRLYGLDAKAIPNPMEPCIDPGPTAEREIVLKGYTDPKTFVQKHYVKAAQNLVRRGAEVIVMGSTGMSLIADNGGFSKLEDLGIPMEPKHASVPILNVVSVAIKTAEFMIDLIRATGIPSISRVGLYQKAQDTVKKEDFDTIRKYFEKDWEMLPLP